MTPQPERSDVTNGEASPTAATGLVTVMQRIAGARRPSPRAQRILLIVAAVIFVVGSVWSLAELDLETATLRWLPLLAVAAVITPLTIVINAAELRIMADTCGGRMRWGEATRTVVIATAANVLPIPGGALVRVQALRTVGARLGQATIVNLAAAGLWVSASLGVGGAALYRFAPWAALLAVVLSLAGLVVCLVLMRRVAGGRVWTVSSRLLIVEIAFAGLHGLRLLLVLLGLSVNLDLLQALVLGVSAPLAAAAGVFPSGLGLAELLSALIAPLVAVQAAAGYAATAVGRVIGLVVTGLLAVALGARVRTPSEQEASTGPGVNDG